MIVGIVSGLLFGKTGYHLLLSWCCLSIFVFMVRAGCGDGAGGLGQSWGGV